MTSVATRKPEQMPIPTTGDGDSITALLRLAIDKKVPVETLEKLVALHARVADRQAAAEFAAAMADFQATCPPISKTSTASIVTKGGIRYSYSYAELDEIARTVAPLLHPRGLSYSWDSEFADRLLRCTCTLRHVNGHQITASFSAPVDTAAAMGDAQKHAAALTYARRQSLIQVLGITTAEPDTDAASTQKITDIQLGDLETLLADSGADRARFLKYVKVQKLEDVLARDYAAAVQALQAKLRKAAKK